MFLCIWWTYEMERRSPCQRLSASLREPSVVRGWDMSTDLETWPGEPPDNTVHTLIGLYILLAGQHSMSTNNIIRITSNHFIKNKAWHSLVANYVLSLNFALVWPTKPSSPGCLNGWMNDVTNFQWLSDSMRNCKICCLPLKSWKLCKCWRVRKIFILSHANFTLS